MGLTVAVTGPTGEIGISAVTALEREPAVEKIIGMARGTFDPPMHGWSKTIYQRGDILDRDAVDALVAAGVPAAALHRRRSRGSRVSGCDAMEEAARRGACGGQGGADAEAGRSRSGLSAATGPPRRRRDRNRTGGHRSGAARRVQHCR